MQMSGAKLPTPGGNESEVDADGSLFREEVALVDEAA